MPPCNRIMAKQLWMVRTAGKDSHFL